MARRSEARLQHLCLDRERHRPGWRLRQHRLPVHPEVQPLRRPQRDPGHAFAPRLASVLARPRSRDGRRVLPALLHVRRRGRRASSCRGSGTTPWSATTRARSASTRPSWTARSRAARRSGGCPRRRSSVREAGTATGSGTRSWRRDSASRPTHSPEERYTDAATGATGNTLLKLADSLNVFDTGSLAPGVTVQRVDYRLLAFDAGIKYHGIFLQTEIYNAVARRLRGRRPAAGRHRSSTRASTCRPRSIPVPKKLELYGATSQIYGDKDAGFDNSSEYIGGMNFYPADTRNHRFNVQVQRRQSLAGEQHVRLLRRRPGRARRIRRRSRCSSEQAGMRTITRFSGWAAFGGVSCYSSGSSRASCRRRRTRRPPQPAGAAAEFNDSHFHLTNYIQEGIDVRDVPEDHGHARRPLDAVRHPAAAAVVVRELRRFRADLLPAERCAALLLLVHRRLHRERVPIAAAGRSRRASIR